MTLTRLDCSFFRSASGEGDNSSFVAFNPMMQPGRLVFAGSSAVRESIGSQVACKLALQHFVEGVFQHYQPPESDSDIPQDEAGSSDDGLRLLETAFRNANNSVYAFGHQLAAGGRLAASLLGLAIENGFIACGRVGAGGAYLCRSNELFPFFELQERPSGAPVLEGFVGSQSMVSVELASVPLAPADVVFVFSKALDQYQERELSSLVLEFLPWLDLTVKRDFNVNEQLALGACSTIAGQLFPESEPLEFAFMVAAGPETTFLNSVLESPFVPDE